MRGSDRMSGSLFSYIDLEARVPKNHLLHLIRDIVDDVLRSLSDDFSAMYSNLGRPSIPPERLLRALLLQAFYSIRSERQLMEQLEFKLLFRWFVGFGIDEPVLDASSFAKNRERPLQAAVSMRFLNGVVVHRKVSPILSHEHFTVDGTLIDSWTSMKSYQPRMGDNDKGIDGHGRNRDHNFRKQKRSNKSHVSRTDKDARLYRKGNCQESRLCYMGHASMENRNGLVICGGMLLADGMAECEAALAQVGSWRGAALSAGRITLGGDKGYDMADFVEALSARNITPHLARNTQRKLSHGRCRRSAIDGRTMRHPGYHRSQTCRKWIDEVFAWVKTIVGMTKTRFRGHRRVNSAFIFALAAYNLIRLPKHIGAGA